MKTHPISILVSALFLPSLSAFAGVAANFTDGNTTGDQFPGSQGDGWLQGWGVTKNGTQPSLTVDDADPLSVTSGNYLAVTNNGTGDNGFGRLFDGTGTTGVNITQAHTITFDVRIDTLNGWNANTDYITIHGSASSSTYNVQTNASFIIRAYGAASGNAVANRWAFNNGSSTGAISWVDSGMELVAGTTYSFSITSYPATKTYDVSINDGTTTVSQMGLNWRNTTNSPVSTVLAFNQRVSSAADTVGYSLDNVRIEANVSGADTVANFTDGTTPLDLDGWVGSPGNGWDRAWLNPGGVTATVTNTTPIAGSGNYLSVISNKTTASGFGRDFIGNDSLFVDTTQTTVFKFDLRIDELGPDWDSVNDQLTIHATSTINSSYNSDASSTFMIRAHGAATGAAVANQWACSIGTGLGGFTAWADSGMALVEGTTYSFTITSDPVTKTYSVSINNGTSTATVTDKSWRSATASDHIAISQQVSAAGNSIAYSLDNILIENPSNNDFASWADANGASNQTPDQDHDSDGVDNGIEYFMGQVGSGFTSLPVPDSASKVSWTKNPDYLGTFAVQTSQNLVTWNTATHTVNGNQIEYVLPPGQGKIFVRLTVDPE
jgi:hypothetical protein